MEFLFLTSFAEVISYIGYILLALLILLVMITVHEFGHYIVGKIFKFDIEEFAIGFGPKLFSKTKKNGEVFSIRLLPLGGFCSFKGEDEDNDGPGAFNNKKPWQRILVLVAGATMNYVLSIVLIVTMFFAWGQPALMTYKVANDPTIAVENSFQERDVIISANGKTVYLVTDLMNVVSGKNEGDLVPFTVRREGQNVNVNIKLRADTEFKNIEDTQKLYEALGIYFETDLETGAMVNGGMYSTSIRVGFFQTIGRSFEYSFKLAGTIFTVLGQLITGMLGLSSVGGTVTTITITASAIRIGGLRYFFNIASLIGVNLAVFNLLPFPALDGSRVVFTAIEWIRKKPLNRRVEAIIHGVGMVLLLAFAVIVDLQQCF